MVDKKIKVQTEKKCLSASTHPNILGGTLLEVKPPTVSVVTLDITQLYQGRILICDRMALLHLVCIGTGL